MLAFFTTNSGKVPLKLTMGVNLIDDVAFMSPAQASLELRRNGTAVGVRLNGADLNPADEWILGSRQTATIGDDFEVNCSVISGALTSGTTGSWLRLDTARVWSVFAGVGLQSAVVRIQFRRFGGSGILYTSEDIQLYAVSVTWGE